MEKKAFYLLRDAETSWWYEGRALIISRVLKRFLGASRAQEICDVGAGYGGMLRVLSRYGAVSAYEPDPEARAACEKRGYKEVFSATEPFALPPKRFTLIAAFDVLEHTPDDGAFLDKLHNALGDGGHLVLTVPAYQWLWGAHDVAHHHYRRYGRRELASLLEHHGFAVRYRSYWNTLLFFPAAIVRLLGCSGEGALGMPRWLDRIFFTIVRSESLLVPMLRLPFGTGVIVFAEKRKNN